MKINDYLIEDYRNPTGVENLFTSFTKCIMETLNGGYGNKENYFYKIRAKVFADALAFHETNVSDSGIDIAYDVDSMISEVRNSYRTISQYERRVKNSNKAEDEFADKIELLLESISNQIDQLNHFCNELMATVASNFAAYKRTQIYDIFRIEGFYAPDQVDKANAKRSLLRAKKSINNLTSISEDVKEKILNHLDKALAELETTSPRWTKIFGVLKETTFILGALGSLAGGADTLVDLAQASNEVEEVAKTIEESSVHVQPSSLRKIYNIQDSLPSIEVKTVKIQLHPNEENLEEDVIVEVTEVPLDEEE